MSRIANSHTREVGFKSLAAVSYLGPIRSLDVAPVDSLIRMSIIGGRVGRNNLYTRTNSSTAEYFPDKSRLGSTEQVGQGYTCSVLTVNYVNRDVFDLSRVNVW